MRRLLTLVGALAACSESASAPSLPPPAISDAGASAALYRGSITCFGEPAALYQSMHEFSGAITHSSKFVGLNADQLTAAQNLARALALGDIAGARAAATPIGYTVEPIAVGSADTFECLWSAVPDFVKTPPGQGALVVRPTYDRDLDSTEGQCSSNEACSGQPPGSDVSHAIDSAFQAFHSALAVDKTIAIQLHSNTHKDDNGDLLLSNGTKLAFTGSFAEKLFKSLGTHLPAGSDVRTCNDLLKPPTATAVVAAINETVPVQP